MISAFDLPGDEIRMSAIHASGPGGQNVNKVATAIHLSFSVRESSLPDWLKEKVLGLSDSRVKQDGQVVIKASRFRSQERNRQDAMERLDALLAEAQKKEKKRVKTKPSKAAKRRRMDDKKKLGQRKQLRGKVSPDS